jgi:hypothetical protein
MLPKDRSKRSGAVILPSFLGIGAQRAGTSWLDAQLRVHPDIYLPKRRKEVHFFDWYYDRGLEWYREFFPAGDRITEYVAIGEITPNYLYHEETPLRISETIAGCRFVVILRNPVDRAYSQYGLSVRDGGEQRSFREYFEQEPEVFARGLYREQLERYLQVHPLQRFLILIFEPVMSDPQTALGKLADFLAIDATQFERSRIAERANPAYRLRFGTQYAMVRRLGSLLRARDQDWAVNLAKSLGLRRLFGDRGALPPMDTETRQELLSLYRKEITALEELLGIDLHFWRS